MIFQPRAICRSSGSRTHQAANRDLGALATMTHRIVCGPQSSRVELTLTPTSRRPDGRIPNLHVGLDVVPTTRGQSFGWQPTPEQSWEAGRPIVFWYEIAI
jgi:hypothetical protein